MSKHHYKGPISDHFNGKVFYNYNGQGSKTFPELMKWLSSRKKVPWGKYRKQESKKPVGRNENNDFLVTFVNHSTVLIQTMGLNIITDPVFYKRVSPVQWVGPKRFTDPGVNLKDLPKIDLVLQSHNHWDHLDIDSLKYICKRDNSKVITTLGVSLFLNSSGITNTQELDWWQDTEYNPDLKVNCVPAQHFSGRWLSDRNKTLWCGFVLEFSNGRKLYFAGDTGYGDFFKSISEKFGEIDFSLIPIGAYKPEWFMSSVHISPKEAVKVHLEVKSKKSMGIHFGSFALADEGLEEPINDLNNSLSENNMHKEDFITLTEGDNIKI
ncbi:MAG: MBL fold metallo-hydrolase [Candidatus Kapabacteria bacterium]|nr:MBL fold metallo-hydrolase [Candidatus Kapabacteria bacterium]